MNTTTERVKTMIEELGTDQVGFGTLAGASKSVVNQWLSGEIKSIHARYAYNIEQATGYSARWIMLGIGNKKVAAPLTEEERTALDNLRSLPIEEARGFYFQIAKMAAAHRITQRAHAVSDSRDQKTG